MTTNDSTPRPGGQPTPSDAAVDSGAYALNALNPDETRDFEAHLAANDNLRNEVTELGDTAVLLGLAVAPVEPSPQLKSNIMALLASTPQLPRDIAPVRNITSAAQPTAAQEPANTADTTDFGSVPATGAEARAKARWFRRPAVALTAAAAAIALFVGGGVISSLTTDATFQQSQADALAAITSADDSQQAVAAVSTGGTATLVWSADLGKSALITRGLAELPDDSTYELWYIDPAGTPTPAGLLNDDTWRVLEGTMSEGATVGVTVEPSGGSDAPTTAPIVAIASA